MFGHLDLNNDGLLSAQEMYDLEHDQVSVLKSIESLYCKNFYLIRMKSA